MQWTVRYFRHQAGQWEKWGSQAEHATKPGAAAYAARKVVMWSQMAKEAEHKFVLINDMYHQMT